MLAMSSSGNDIFDNVLCSSRRGRERWRERDYTFPPTDWSNFAENVDDGMGLVDRFRCAIIKCEAEILLENNTIFHRNFAINLKFDFFLSESRSL
jgi:hypothetical protein